MEAQAPINIYMKHSRSQSERGELSPRAPVNHAAASSLELPVRWRQRDGTCSGADAHIHAGAHGPLWASSRHPSKRVQVGLHSQDPSGSLERKHFQAAAAADAELKGEQTAVLI